MTKQINLTIPKNWNELSPVQLQNVAHQLYLYQEIIKDTPEAENEMASRLYLQVSKEMLRGNSWKAIRAALKEMRPKAFVPLTKFIYKSVDRTKFIETVTIDKKVYHAPGQRIRNITMGEFSYIDSCFYRWRQSKKIIWLNVLCAALYREAANEPAEIDIRKPFVKQAVDVRADAFRKLPLKTKLAISYTYEGCRNHIANTFPLIFPKAIVVEGQAKMPPPKYVSFGEIILDKIEGDPSKLEETNKVLVYDFLNIMSNDIKKFNKRQ